MWIALAVVGALVLLAIGVGAGYATGAGARSDLAAAQASLSAAQANAGSLTQKAAALTATTTACQNALRASTALEAQWNNLWADETALWNERSEARFNALLQHMDTQYRAMQQAEGRVATLTEQCTGTGT